MSGENRSPSKKESYSAHLGREGGMVASGKFGSGGELPSVSASLQALVAIDDITRALMSANHEDHRAFRRALDAANALRRYFEGIQALERLADADSQAKVPV